MNDDLKNKMIRIPKKFVGLHAHSTFSVGDAIGLPQDHIDFAIKNGSDALALTDHGNMNGVSHQQLKIADLAKNGQKFKAIPGVEAYFVDDLVAWKELKEQVAEQKEAEKLEKKKKAISKATDKLVEHFLGNELASTEEELDAASAVKKTSTEDEEGGTIVENEEESKAQKFLDPINQRNHLVLLPKNNEGLKALFQICSEASINGYYKYPRVDFEMLRKHANGNIIGLSACLAGIPTRVLSKHLPVGDFKNMGPGTEHDFEAVQKELAEYVQKFYSVLGPENYFLEIQFNRLPIQHLINLHILEFSKRTGVKVVATADSHYSNPDHWREREVYKAMAWASKTKGVVDVNTLPKKIDELKCELYPKNAKEMWESHMAYSEPYSKFYEPFNEKIADAIEISHDIAHEMIGDVKIDKQIKLPSITKLVSKEKIDDLQAKLGVEASEDDIAFKELVSLAIEGLKWRKKASKDEYILRLKRELEVIKKLKFAKYFLTYYHIMRVVGERMLIGNARGSAGGSLLAYVLNITQMDPIRFGLLFERFLTSKKKGYPDIDSDFADRDGAVKLLMEYFGEENVIPVSNFAQLQLRSLIKDLARLYGVPFDVVNDMTMRIEQETLAVDRTEAGFDKGTWVLTFESANENSPTFQRLLEEYPEFERSLKILFKQMRNISRHAGGVIITNNSREAMPLIRNGGELQTPWPEGLNFRHLEELGLLKFDILGIGTLRMFQECVRKILQNKGISNPTIGQIKNWFWDNLHPDNNMMDDMHVYKHVFWDGNYAGIYQFVQENTRQFMAQMKPKSILDIATATSIFRPGPLSLNVDKKFLENRKNPQNVVFQHPLLKEVYAETSGLLVFQEQLQMIYHKLAGVDLEDTDSVRKAFTKKDISNREKAAKERDALRDTFINLCQKANNISPGISGDIFDNMEKLVAYSFNKSHAIAYAIMTYQCAWFLTYYPDEWITTNIDYATSDKGKVSGKEDPKAIAIREAQKLGYRIGKADINKSSYSFTVENKVLIPSFASLKYVGKTVMGEIEKFRPYKRFTDILINDDNTWRHSKFNKRALGTLIQLEALDSLDIVGPDKLFKNYRQLYLVMIDHYDQLKRTAARKKDNDVKAAILNLVKEVENEPDWTLAEKIDFSSTLAGSVDTSIIVSKEVRDELTSGNFYSIDECEDRGKGSYWCIVSSVEPATTKTGKKYLKLRVFADANAEYTCFLWDYNGKAEDFKKFDVIVGVFSKNDFGISAKSNTIYKIGK